MLQQISGFSEDDIKAKVYDGQMMKKLLQYLKSYKFYVFISFLMLLLITASELAVPAVTKIAVDEHIVSNKDLIAFDTKIAQEDFKTRYKKVKFKEYAYKNKYYLLFPDHKLSFIDEKEISQLKQQKRFISKVTLLKNKAASLELLKDLDVKILSQDFAAVRAKELLRLKKEGIIDKAQLRKLQTYNIHRLRFFGLILFLIIASQFAFYYFQIFTINYASQHAMYDLRRDVFAHVSRMPLSFFDKNPVGRLVTRVTNDVRTLDEMLSNGLIQLLQDFFVLGGISFPHLYKKDQSYLPGSKEKNSKDKLSFVGKHIRRKNHPII